MGTEKSPSPYGQAKCYPLVRGSLYGTGKNPIHVCSGMMLHGGNCHVEVGS